MNHTLTLFRELHHQITNGSSQCKGDWSLVTFLDEHSHASLEYYSPSDLLSTSLGQLPRICLSGLVLPSLNLPFSFFGPAAILKFPAMLFQSNGLAEH